ncbi:leucine-rich repeat protein [Porcipelethomonas sp.]|uniref:leucine-rich repeat protein n=1 Tax=Porcipelethomonas sp. TaxID=2981675 RepID=UPI003EF387DB
MKKLKLKKILADISAAAVCVNLLTCSGFTIFAEEDADIVSDKEAAISTSEDLISDIYNTELPGLEPDYSDNDNIILYDTQNGLNYSNEAVAGPEKLNLESVNGIFSDKPIIADNEETTEAPSGIITGTCGDNVTFTLDSDTGELIISGSGDMDFPTTYYSDLPFYSYKDVITSVVIENGVTSIEDYSFMSCASIENIVIPEGVISIGKKAFNGCSSLNKVIIPDSVESVGEQAFYGCSKLTNVTLSANMTSIEYGTFYNCGSLTDIKIPEGIVSIGGYAFYNCEALASVSLPDSLESIGEYAFGYCTALTDIILPGGLTSISQQAFYNCSSLENINIPASVVSIGEHAFANTAFMENKTGDFVILGNGILYQYNGSSTSVSIPEDVKSISDSVFSDHTEIESVVLPSGLVTIGEEAFSGCTSLAEIEINENTAYIGYNAFYNTPFIKAHNEDMVIFGKAVYCYQGNENRITIPDGIVSITDYAFKFHFNLEKISIPESVTKIGYGAFVGCHSMAYVVIPETVTELDKYSFGYYCANGTSGTFLKRSLKIFGISGSEAEIYASDNGLTFNAMDDGLQGECGEGAVWSLNAETGELTISGTGDMTSYSGIYGSNMSPFYQYRDIIESVKIESGITSVGNDAFYGCINLKNVTLSDSIEMIGDYAFKGCSLLNSVNIPSVAESIGNYAFSECASLKTILIPESIVSIGTAAFTSCSRLEEIQVSSENINFSSLDGILYDNSVTRLICVPAGSNIRTFEIPDTVTAVEQYALYYNENIQNVILPESLYSINNYSFYQCKSLKKMIFKGAAPVINSTGYSLTDNITIYCSFSKSGWTSLKESITYPEHLTWVDSDDLADADILTISMEKTELSAGESIQARLVINPVIAADISWSSSDTSVAVISSEGRLTAVNPGKAVITAESADGMYKAECTVTVTGEEFKFPENEIIALENGELNYTSVGTVTQQIPCDTLHGLYFLSGSNLSFYSFITRSCENVYTFSGCSSAYSENNKLYVAYGNTCYIYDLIGQNLVSHICLAGYSCDAIGADKLGRIYVAAKDNNNSQCEKVFLYSPDGEILSEMISPTKVYCFSGFDNTNGNFYMETYYDYYSWGYSHPGHALTMGNVTDNIIMNVETYSGFLEQGIISRSFNCIEYLCQNYYMLHQNSAALLGDKYLTAASVLTSQVTFIDSDSQGLNTCMTLSRTAQEYELESDYYDTSSIGVRAVYNENHNSIIVYENNKTLSEYNMTTGEKISEANTEHYVFNLLKINDSLIIIEKENDSYYIEIMDWSDPEGISINAQTDTMPVGTTQQLTVESGTSYKSVFNWSSSDSSIASVTDTGIVSAWKKGNAIITCTSKDGTYTAEYIIKVIASDISVSVKTVEELEGQLSSNISCNNYTTYGNVVDSYLIENADKTFTRVENSGDGNIIVETYSADYKLTDSINLECELKYFGGFYSGEEYNYFVFGQSNPTESDSCEVLRIVKYTKDWERLEQCSVYGANTYIPFDAGSLRMTETGGMLYVYTCHEMYKSSDGYHHQANMTYVMDIEIMEIIQSYYDVMNLSYGYVSHSFNQFIQTDGEYVYRVDHGDANPRAVSITRCGTDDKITNVSYIKPLPINGGYGDNSTGVSVGGFELSSGNCLIAGNSVDMSDSSSYSSSGQRNIFLTVTDKSFNSTDTVWLTDYTSEDNITPRTPHLVKLNDEQFLIMWEEYNTKTSQVKVKIAAVSGNGTLISEIKSADLRLSDCKPVFCSDSLIRWYVSDKSSVSMYTINPYDLDSIEDSIPEVTTSVTSKPSVTTTTTAKTTAKTTSKTTTETSLSIVSKSSTDITVSVSEVTSNTTVTTSDVTTGTAESDDGVVLSKTELDLSVGDKVHLKLTGYDGEILWISSNKDVAVVDESGCVQAVGEGYATIFVLYGDKNLTCKVTVESGIISDYILGDANNDGILNIRDAAFIASKLAKGLASELSESADYNGDGVVNVRDAAAIARDMANKFKQ